MKTFRHNTNERNKSNVIKLRMKYGAAGYGIYMMLLERLDEEPKLRSDLDYDVLAYDFHESADMIRHIVEDFDLFIIDIESETFSHEEINKQLMTKAKRQQQEKLLDEYIGQRLANTKWINHIVDTHSTSPERIRAILQSHFRDRILSSYTFLPDSRVLRGILNNLLENILKKE